MIPHLKITDRGLVDADHFKLISLDGDYLDDQATPLP